MLWRIVKGSFTRNKRGKFLAVITIALGTSLATAMLSVMLDVGDKVNRELKTYGANILVTPKAGKDFGEGRQFLAEEDLGKLKTIFWANNIVAFAPYLEDQAMVAGSGRTVSVVGTWFNRRLELPTGESFTTGIQQLKPWWQVTGSWPTEGQDGAMVGAALAKALGTSPGDRLELIFPVAAREVKQSLTVKGIFASGGQDEEKIYVPLAWLQRVLGLPGKVARVEVSALTTPENELARKAAAEPQALTRREYEIWYCTAYVSSIAYQIEEAIPGTQAKPIRQVAESEGVILRKVQLLMLLLTAAALVSSALGISSLMTAAVLERRREIGLLKALGAEDGAVILLFVAETLIMGLVGGLVGYGSGFGLAQAIGRSVFGAAVAFNGLVVPLALLLAVGVALAGGWPAIRFLLNLRPAEVLSGA